MQIVVQVPFLHSSSAHCIQETRDFKLALKLQQEEIDKSPSEQQEHTAVQDVNVAENRENDSELEFEANAAAALLQLHQISKYSSAL